MERLRQLETEYLAIRPSFPLTAFTVRHNVFKTTIEVEAQPGDFKSGVRNHTSVSCAPLDTVPAPDVDLTTHVCLSVQPS